MLKVYPNPFTALGPDGMPCGRVLVEPTHPRPLDIVGGKLVKVRAERADDKRHTPKERAAAKRLDVRDSLIRGVATVRMRPIEVSPEQYFKQRCGSGDLVAADKATYAALFGASAKGFRTPFEFLAAERKARIAEWVAIHGERPALANHVLVAEGAEIKLVPRAGRPRTKQPAAPADEAVAPTAAVSPDAPRGAPRSSRAAPAASP